MTQPQIKSRRETELSAKRILANCINQQLSSKDKIKRQIDGARSPTKGENGSTVTTARRQDVKAQLTTINARADVALLEVRVTAGIKSEAVADARVLGQTTLCGKL
jgi:hypothetical protein